VKNVTTLMAVEIIGREEERAAIDAFLDRLADGPGAFVLSGEPGIGKTTLWEAGLAMAEQRFEHVLLHRGAEAEASLSFTGLSDLLAPVFDEVAPSLSPLRRHALEVALLLAEPGEAAPDRGAIGIALLDALRTLAAEGPVIVALDDFQWLDSSSAGVLQVALRRLRDEPIGVLATLRRAPETDVLLELERALREERLTRILLGPLSLSSLHRLLDERVGLELTRPELVRIQEASAGNPFFALELGRELERTGTRPESGQTLPVPDSLHELLDGRLARLPTETGDVMLFAAALARPTVDLVTAAHGDRAGVLEALENASREGVVELDDSRLRFSHPLLASICYEQAQPWKRRAIHAALARAVADIEEQARHMALSVDGPDPIAASYLDAAAEHAAARGATGSASELAELAAELTPSDPKSARRRRFRAANLHRLAGDGDRATALLEQLLEEVPSGVERADVLFELAMTLRGDPSSLIGLCDEALAEASGDDVRSTRILAFRTWGNLLAGNVGAALVDGEAALEKAERVGDPALLATAIHRLGHARTWAAEITPGLIERGVEIEERLGLELEWFDSPRYDFAHNLMRQGKLDRARVLFEDIESRALERGDEVSRVMILWPLAQVEWLAGRWQRAQDHVLTAHELAEQTQHPLGLMWAGRIGTLIEADLGLVEQARAFAEQGLVLAQATSNEFYAIATLGALGRLELVLGNLEAAGRYLRDLPGRLLAGGLNDPTPPVWADAIEALIALGELEQARSYLGAWEANARRLGSPCALAPAARCRGLLAAAEGDPVDARASLESSLAELEQHQYPFEQARTLLCLGAVLRQTQQKRAARGTLGQALAIFEELGAPLWAERAHAELRRISGRRAPPSDELTETERRVAELAARGRTNREIAAQLYVSVSTVESNLTRVYRKLGVRSRAELAGRVQLDDAVQP
jgi:ATP/maltotriose-dependent transcriptional regulator MalT